MLNELDNLIAFADDKFSNSGGVPPLLHQDVELFRVKYELTPYDFCDLFARHIVNKYDARKLEFNVGDTAMISISAYILDQYNVTLPSYAEEVYFAFDEGEYRHKGDSDSIDPSEKYTRPKIQSIEIRDKVLGKVL